MPCNLASMEARQGFTQAPPKKPSAGMLGTRPYAERFSQKGWGAQPPRLLFGAPRAELCTTRTTIQRSAPRRNANGEGAVGSARGGRAPRFQFEIVPTPQGLTSR